MARKTDIRLRRSNSANAIPTHENLSDGELAMNTMDGALYFKKSDNTIITAHDNTIMHIDSQNNRVGINKTNPGYRLDVDGNIHATAAYINGYIYHTGDTDTYINYSTDTIILSAGGVESTLKGNGRVGLGTTDPKAHLDVANGTIRAQGFSTIAGGAGLEMRYDSSSGSEWGGILVFDRSTSSYQELRLEGNIIKLREAGNTVMTIDGGSVGIGTTSPSRKLEVDFTGSTVGARFTRSDTTGSSTIEFANSAGVKSNIGFNAGTNKFDINHNSAIRLSVDNNGAVTFNEAFTFPTSIGSAGQILKVPSSGTSLIWADDAGGGSATVVTDTDGDTKIQVEESADEDIIRFDTAGSQRMVILANGNVGIGTNNPGYLLDVNPGTAGAFARLKGTHASIMLDRSSTNHDSNVMFVTAGATKWRLWNDGSDNTLQIRDEVNSANVMTWETGGNVGIGTASPSSVLDVAGSAAVLTITDTRNQSFTVGDTMCSLAFDSDDASGGAGTASHPRALISLVAETTFGSSTGLSFSTKQDTTTAPTEKMRISTAGNVGINDTSPDRKVSIIGDSSSEGQYPLSLDATNTDYTLEFRRNGTSQWWIKQSGSSFNIHENGVGDHFRISAGGNVGIGTSSPDALLDLEGSFEGNNNFALKFTNTMGTGAVGGFRSHGTNGEHLTMYQEGARKQSWGETEVLFYGASDAEIVRFKNDGNVGIGTNNPGFKLDVNGAGRFTGAVTMDSTVTFSNATATNMLNMGNNNIYNVNAIAMADPGPNEGISWTNTKIFESPDDLTTNSAGNLQLVYNGTRRLTVNNTGIDVNGTITGATNISKLAASTATGNINTEDGANTWAKLATYSRTGNYNDGSFVYAVVTEEQSTGNSGLISVKVRWHDVTGSSSPTIDVQWVSLQSDGVSNGIVRTDSFKLIGDSVGGDIELWVQKKTNYGHVELWELAYNKETNNAITVSYETNSAWQSSTPTGTLVNKTSSTLKFDGRPVMIGDNYSNATNLTLTGNITVGDGHYIGGESTNDNLLLLSSANENIVLSGANDLYFKTGGTAYNSTGSTRMYIQNSTGRVAIGGGNTAPRSTLHVQGSNDSNGGIILSSSATNSTQKVGRIKTQHYTNAEEPFTAILTNAQQTTNLVNIGGSSGAENAATDIKFFTASNNTTLTGSVRMHIKSDGKVGIGTSSPGRKLTIQGGSGDNLPVRIIGGSGTSHGSLEFKDPNTTADYKVTIGSKTDDFYIQAGGTEKVRVTSDGNLGVGTPNPSSKLVVDSGSANLVAQFKSTDNSALISIADNDTTVYVSAENARASFGFYTGTNVDNLNIDSNGHVGLGTNTLTHNLNIVDTTTSTSVATMTGLLIQNDDQGANSLAGIRLRHQRSSAGSYSANNIYMDQFNLYLDCDEAFIVKNNGNTALTIDGNRNAKFSSGTQANLLYVNASNDRVGINTASPSYSLDVRGSSNILLKLASTGTDQNARMIFSPSDGDKDWNIGANDNGDFSWYDATNARTPVSISLGAAQNSLVINSSGNITMSQNLTIQGTLTVSGTTTTVNTTNLEVTDALIELQHGLTGANTNDLGIIMERGSSGSNVAIVFDESENQIVLGYTTNVGSDTGAISFNSLTNMNAGNIQAGNSANSKHVRAYHSDGAYTDLHGYGLEFSRTSSYIRPENDGTQILYIGNADTSKDWQEVQIRTTNGTKIKSGNLIVDTGSIGIGEASPNYTIHTKKDMASSPSNIIYMEMSGTNNNGGGGGIRFDTSASNSDETKYYAGMEAVRADTSDGSNTLLFYTAKTAVGSGAPTAKMAIDQDGRVGIGTTTPNNTCSLEVYKSGEDSVLRIHEDGGSYASRIHLRSGGNDARIQLPNTSSGLEIRTESNLVSGSAALTLQTNGRADFGYAVRIEEYQIDTTETSTSATTEVAIHSFAAATFRSARYTVQVTNSTDSAYHTTELLLVHDGTTANITEFGTIFTGTAAEATFDADINSGNVRLLASPASGDSMEFKVIAHSVTV